ncbi:MAG: hypothetical protein ACR2OG_16875 [Gemmatimonadaceae bacterium]
MRRKIWLCLMLLMASPLASCTKRRDASAASATDSLSATASPATGPADSGAGMRDSTRQSARRARSAARADQVDRGLDNTTRASRAPTLRHKPGEPRADTFKKPERTPIYPKTPPPTR